MDAKAPRRASPYRVVKTVLSAFFGVRRRAGHEEDAAKVTPAQIIATGIIAAVLLVTGLIVLVKFIVSSAAK